MEFNKFIQELIDRYSKHGVSEIAISVMENICTIMLVGKNQVREGAIYVGIDRPEDMDNIPLVYGEVRVEFPINEEEVLSYFDESFERASKAPPVIIEGIGRDEIHELVVTATRVLNCRECTARLEEDNIYGLCADCYDTSIN